MRPPRSWTCTGLFLARLVLAAVFLSAGVIKLWQPPEAFADSIASFRLLPAALVHLLAMLLPPLEILVGGALLLGKPGSTGALGAAVLSTGFLVALSVALMQGITVECGCFGAGQAWFGLNPRQQMWFDLGRDVLLVAMSALLYCFTPSRLKAQPVQGE